MSSTIKTALSRLLLAGPMLLGLGLAACNQTPKGPIAVQLTYTPRSAEAMPVVPLPQQGGIPAVYIEPVVDARADRNTIGSNVEDAVVLPVTATGKTVEEFVADVLRQELQGSGLNVVEKSGFASRSVRAEVVEFKATESKTYTADVRLRVAIVGGDGTKVIWQGVTAGQGRNWGRSRSAENYREVLSDALKRSIGQMLSEPQAVQALTTGSLPTPPQTATPTPVAPVPVVPVTPANTPNTASPRPEPKPVNTPTTKPVNPLD